MVRHYPCAIRIDPRSIVCDEHNEVIDDVGEEEEDEDDGSDFALFCGDREGLRDGDEGEDVEGGEELLAEIHGVLALLRLDLGLVEEAGDQVAALLAGGVEVLGLVGLGGRGGHGWC